MNFSWLEKGRVAGCRGPRTHKDLDYLSSSGIRALVRLTQEDIGISVADVHASGLEDCHEPVEDCTAPLPDQVDRIVRFIVSCVEAGKPVAVSCGAGRGRTGTILACYLIARGDSAENAMQRVIRERPCSDEIFEVPGQRGAIIEFEQRVERVSRSKFERH
jgi:atypical dual specificity phosphatase